MTPDIQYVAFQQAWDCPAGEELIDHNAIDLGYDPKLFVSFATQIALAEYYRRMKGTLGPLRNCKDSEWHQG